MKKASPKMKTKWERGKKNQSKLFISSVAGKAGQVISKGGKAKWSSEAAKQRCQNDEGVESHINFLLYHVATG